MENTENHTDSPLASFDKLVWARDGQPTGSYQLRVGDLYITTNEWDKNAAEKWLPMIVAAVNAYDAKIPTKNL